MHIGYAGLGKGRDSWLSEVIKAVLVFCRGCIMSNRVMGYQTSVRTVRQSM